MEPNLQLETIRTLVDRRNAFDNNKFVTDPRLCQTLIIPIDTWLRKIRGYKDGDTRRDIRLYIYSAITKRDIGSTYDLYTIEVRTIRDYLADFATLTITEDGIRLLEYLEKRYLNGDLPFESRSHGSKSGTTPIVPDMSEAPF